MVGKRPVTGGFVLPHPFHDEAVKWMGHPRFVDSWQKALEDVLGPLVPQSLVPSFPWSLSPCALACGGAGGALFGVLARGGDGGEAAAGEHVCEEA